MTDPFRQFNIARNLGAAALLRLRAETLLEYAASGGGGPSSKTSSSRYLSKPLRKSRSFGQAKAAMRSSSSRSASVTGTIPRSAS